MGVIHAVSHIIFTIKFPRSESTETITAQSLRQLASTCNWRECKRHVQLARMQETHAIGANARDTRKWCEYKRGSRRKGPNNDGRMMTSTYRKLSRCNAAAFLPACTVEKRDPTKGLYTLHKNACGNAETRRLQSFRQDISVGRMRTRVEQNAPTCVCLYVCARIYTYARTHAKVCIYIYAYIYILYTCCSLLILLRKRVIQINTTHTRSTLYFTRILGP
jgi:hypothetical protein